jgi:copper chaperone CopZ
MKRILVSVVAMAFVCGMCARAAEEMTPEQKQRAAVLKAAGLSSSKPKPAAEKSAAAPGATTGKSGLVTVEFPVTGMMCNNCMDNAKMAFTSEPGVTDAKPDMSKNMTLVTYDSSKTSLEQILKAFNAKKIKRLDAALPGEKIKEKEYHYDGKEETLSGALAIKGKDAGPNVVCRVVARRQGEDERAINVIATGEIAKQIEEARGKGERPQLTGVVSAEGITVSKVN